MYVSLLAVTYITIGIAHAVGFEGRIASALEEVRGEFEDERSLQAFGKAAGLCFILFWPVLDIYLFVF